MKQIIITLSLMVFANTAKSQKVSEFFFNLYTDSLKKGTYNYINVDGKMEDGTWLPLTSKQIRLSSPACKFEGNELILPADCKEEKIPVKATLIADSSRFIEKIIWIKKLPDPEILPEEPQPLQKTRRRKN